LIFLGFYSRAFFYSAIWPICCSHTGAAATALRPIAADATSALAEAARKKAAREVAAFPIKRFDRR
jgi:hypothetical protein